MNPIFLVHLRYLFQLSSFLLQIITRRDCEQQDLEYYYGKPKKVGKDEGARRIIGQPVLENWNSKSESIESGSNSSVANGLFGPIWDNIDLKDAGVDERIEKLVNHLFRIIQVSKHMLAKIWGSLEWTFNMIFTIKFCCPKCQSVKKNNPVVYSPSVSGK